MLQLVSILIFVVIGLVHSEHSWLENNHRDDLTEGLSGFLCACRRVTCGIHEPYVYYLWTLLLLSLTV